MKIWVKSSSGKVWIRNATAIDLTHSVSMSGVNNAGKFGLAYILTIFGLSLTLINGAPINEVSYASKNLYSNLVGQKFKPWRNKALKKPLPPSIKTVALKLPDVDKTISNSFMSSFFHVLDSTKNPLARQRQYLKGHRLSRGQKLHFYALALAELGPNGTQKDYAMLIETAYNRGVTEDDTHIIQNLTRAYYQPLRKYRYKKYWIKVKVGKGKKRRTKKVRRTKKLVTAGWRNYTRYKKRLQASPALYTKLDNAHQVVLAGSNYSNLGTQNASAGVARRAKKTQTVTAETTTGETISRKDRESYSKKHGHETIIKTKKWVEDTSKQLNEYRELLKSPTDKKPKNVMKQYKDAVKKAKDYLRSVSVGGALGLEGSGKVMSKHGFDSIGNLNNPTAIKVSKAMIQYNKYAAQNGLPKAYLISGARFGHLHSMPGGFNNKTKSQHSAGLAVDITFGKGLEHANKSDAMYAFSKFAKAEGLYWGKEIYGDHEGHHWQSHPGKYNIFRKHFNDKKLIEAELDRMLHADPFNPKGPLVTEQMQEFMTASVESDQL